MRFPHGWSAPMSLLARLERRFGAWAIPNLTLLLIVGQFAVYILDIASGIQGEESLVGRLDLDGDKVLAGEVWRLFTYVFIPPGVGQSAILWNVIAWMFFYFIGSVMEQSWGVFRYNAFICIGWLATTAVAMIQPSAPATNAFFLSSVFLAFARLYPDYVIRLMLILPIKAKWLALIQWILVTLSLTTPFWLVSLASVANYLLFFWKEHYRDFHDKRRRAVFQAKAAPAKKSGRILHTCSICGLSSADEPKTQFRYCSQCAGQKCYCPAHIRDHKHVAE